MGTQNKNVWSCTIKDYSPVSPPPSPSPLHHALTLLPSVTPETMIAEDKMWSVVVDIWILISFFIHSFNSYSVLLLLCSHTFTIKHQSSAWISVALCLCLMQANRTFFKDCMESEFKSYKMLFVYIKLCQNDMTKILSEIYCPSTAVTFPTVGLSVTSCNHASETLG